MPALARLLGTDCNTLLCFKDELSNSEIAVLLNKMQACLQEKGLQEGYEYIAQKLREYPSCESLAYYAALLLEGALMYQTEERQEEFLFYRKEIERLYEFAAKSKQTEIKDQVLASLVEKKIQDHHWEQAEKLLEQMTQPPKSFGANKKQLQAKLYMEKKEYAQAAKLLEEELIGQTLHIDAILLTLMKIALKEECLKDAQEIAAIHDEVQQLLGFRIEQPRLAQFSLACEQKNGAACIRLLSEILHSFEQISQVKDKALYRHLQTKQAPEDFGTQLKKMFLRALTCDPETKFLCEIPEVQAMIEKNS